MTSRLSALSIGLLVLFAIATRVAYVREAYVVPDEFEHLHAAYLVAQGQTPYADFFEHHPPLYYYLAAALLPMHHPSFETIVLARYLSLAVSFLTIALCWLWVRRSFGRAHAGVVVALLLANFFLFSRGTLAYLDTYAGALVVLSGLCLSVSPGRPPFAFLAAAALGAGALFTPKAAPAVLAPVVFFLGRGLHEGRSAQMRRRWLRDLAAFAAGGIAPALLLPILLGGHGVVKFFDDNILLNMAWKARHFPTRELGVLAATDGLVYGLAAIGTIIQLVRLARRRLEVTAADLPALYLIATAGGVLLLPVVWEEFFILMVPTAVIVAGVTLVEWWNEQLCINGHLTPFVRDRNWLVSHVLVALLAVMALDLGLRSLAPIRPMALPAVVAVVIGWIAAGTAARRSEGGRQALLCLLLLLVFPVAEQIDWIPKNTNAEQRKEVAYVLANTQPTDTVFDGYSGLGLFRPHAYKYWFLHEEIQAMLPPDDRGKHIVEALKQHRPALVIEDQYVAMLPRSVRDYIDAHYGSTQFPEIKRLKKGAIATARPTSPTGHDAVTERSGDVAPD